MVLRRIFSRRKSRKNAKDKNAKDPKAVPVAAKDQESFKKIIVQNNNWAKEMVKRDKDFFARLANSQHPEYLWIGCADSRVAANLLTGTEPGDMFVHRNVGNIVAHSDPNCMSSLAYSVGALKVKHVILCGHYGCGAVKAALTLPSSTEGVVSLWIDHIRAVRNKWVRELAQYDDNGKWRRLCELNAIEQAIHVCTSYAVQTAWKSGQELYVSCIIYDVADGSIRTLMKPIASMEDLLASGPKASDIPDDITEVEKAPLAWLVAFKNGVSNILKYEA